MAVPTSAQISFEPRTRLRLGSAVSVRWSVPEPNSTDATHTAKTIAAMPNAIPSANAGIVAYLSTLPGGKTSSAAPTISEIANTLPAVQRGSAR